MILSRDSILGSVDFEIYKIEVPKWGGEVCLRPFTAKLKDKIEQLQLKPNPNNSPRSIALAGSICDESGKLIFTDSDIESLSQKSGESVDIVMKKILEINGLTEAQLDESVKN